MSQEEPIYKRSQHGPLQFFIDGVRMKIRDVIKIIEGDGWKLDRTAGSHRQYGHPEKQDTVTIAGHPSKDIPQGTLANILKQAGLKK